MSEIQFNIEFESFEFSGDEKASREFIAKLLRKMAQSVLDGGEQEDCGGSHIHEWGPILDDNQAQFGYWNLQIDED